MKFFKFEIKYVLRQPIVWIFMLILTLLVSLAVAIPEVQIGGGMDNLLINSPYVVQTNYLVLILIGFLFFIPMFINGALREYNNNMQEITFTTPVTKSSFFFGKFFAGLVLGAIPFVGIILGFIIGVMVPGVDAERVGAFSWAAHLHSFLIFVLPVAFIFGTVVFTITLATKKAMYGYIGALAFLVMALAWPNFVKGIDHQLLIAYLDPLGVQTFNFITKYWSPAEKNELFVTLANPLMLVNRLIWMTVFGLILLAAYFKFQFTTGVSKKKKAGKAEKIFSDTSMAIPVFKPNFSSGTGWTQYLNAVKLNTKYIVKSGFFLIIVMFYIVQLLTGAINAGFYGVDVLPVTGHVVRSLIGPTYMFLTIVLVFFSGELYWREREKKMAGIIDATPSSVSVHYLGKFTAIMVALFLLTLVGVIVGIAYQLSHGFSAIKLDVYFVFGILKPLLGMVFWLSVSFLVQSLVHNKFVGYFVVIILILSMPFMGKIFDFGTKLLILNVTPRFEYSDMNKYGFYEAYAWFRTYWLLMAAILGVLTTLFWQKGEIAGWKDRIRVFKKRLTGRKKMTLGVLSTIFVLVAGFIFYNTKVLNTIFTSKDEEKFAAAYEKNFKKYESLVQPILTDAKYTVDIYPEKRDFVVVSKLKVKNKSDKAIDSLHFSVDINSGLEMKIEIPEAELVFTGEYGSYHIYRLKSPLLPGETMDYSITTSYQKEGFNNSGTTLVYHNGTFFNTSGILPSVGYEKRIELSSKSTRKKYGLPEKPTRVAPVKADCGEECMSNYLNKYSQWVNFETVISTSDDQIAVAPGSLVKKWTKDGRNYYHYKVDTPSENFVSFSSAKYDVKRDKLGDIDIEVYYHEEHPYNVDRMISALKSAITYCSDNYGKYYHKQARIIEFPYGEYAQAFPGTMPYSENIGFILDLDNEDDIDMAFKVGAHETSHQWWAHQVVGANVQGSTMLSESFAEYTSLMVLRKEYGDKLITKYTKYDRDRYLSGRARENMKEEPLYKVEGQGYVRYPKGGLSLFALQEYIGEDSLNSALSSFLHEYAYQEPPYPTTLDFLRHLEPRVPDSLQYLIDDYLKDITFFDARIKEAKVEEQSGRFTINADLYLKKTKADSLGTEHQVTLNDLVPIGLYVDNNGKDSLIDYRFFHINDELTKLDYSVTTKPEKIIIDPKHLLMDRVLDDNEKGL